MFDFWSQLFDAPELVVSRDPVSGNYISDNYVLRHINIITMLLLKLINITLSLRITTLSHNVDQIWVCYMFTATCGIYSPVYIHSIQYYFLYIYYIHTVILLYT